VACVAPRAPGGRYMTLVDAPLPVYGRRSHLVRYLVVGYTLLICYASWYPFHSWREPADAWFAFVFAPWPRYYTLSDVMLNVLGYLPFGFLLALALLPRTDVRAGAVLATLAGTLLSFGMETVQQFMPARVASNLDLLANSLGGMIGALLGMTVGERLLLSGNLYRLRQRVFLAGAAVDVGFAMLVAWLFTQFSPQVWLFGNGDLRWLIALAPNLQFSPTSYRWLETGVTAMNLAAICLFTAALAKPGQGVGGPLLALIGVALALKSVAALTLFVPGDAALWLTPGSMLGIPAGLLLYLALLWLPRRGMLLASASLLACGAFLVNVAPDNPYIEAAVQTWQHGHFLSFSGLTRLVSTLWPAIACGYLLWLLRTPLAISAQSRE
jgi:VanZ family protein